MLPIPKLLINPGHHRAYYYFFSLYFTVFVSINSPCIYSWLVVGNIASLRLCYFAVLKSGYCFTSEKCFCKDISKVSIIVWISLL